MNEIISNLIEVNLPSEDSFLKIKETLTRIGIASKKDKKLFQSCHILHKRGKYYIVHFKELFILDGKTNDFSEEDESRRNAIVKLLGEWRLVDIDLSMISGDFAHMSQIKILSYAEKDDWELVPKYNIGKT